MPDRMEQAAVDLHWLATLLTGSREMALELTTRAIDLADDENAFFSTWMEAWSRRKFIARVLSAVREELNESARRTQLRRLEEFPLPTPGWTINQNTTRSKLEQALVAIDAFPRATVLLLIYERVPLEDTAILLNAAADLVRKAAAVGTWELTVNLAKIQGWKASMNGHQHVSIS